MNQGQLPSIGKASKKKEIIKNLDKYFLQIQVCSPLDWHVVPGIAASKKGGAVFVNQTGDNKWWEIKFKNSGKTSIVSFMNSLLLWCLKTEVQTWIHHLKGTVQRDGYFLISTFCACADVFQGLLKPFFHYPIKLLTFYLLLTYWSRPQNFLLCDWSMFPNVGLSWAAGKMR